MLEGKHQVKMKVGMELKGIYIVATLCAENGMAMR